MSRIKMERLKLKDRMPASKKPIAPINCVAPTRVTKSFIEGFTPLLHQPTNHTDVSRTTVESKPNRNNRPNISAVTEAGMPLNPPPKEKKPKNSEAILFPIKSPQIRKLTKALVSPRIP